MKQECMYGKPERTDEMKNIKNIYINTSGEYDKNRGSILYRV